MLKTKEQLLVPKILPLDSRTKVRRLWWWQECRSLSRDLPGGEVTSLTTVRWWLWREDNNTPSTLWSWMQRRYFHLKSCFLRKCLLEQTLAKVPPPPPTKSSTKCLDSKAISRITLSPRPLSHPYHPKSWHALTTRDSKTSPRRNSAASFSTKVWQLKAIIISTIWQLPKWLIQGGFSVTVVAWRIDRPFPTIAWVVAMRVRGLIARPDWSIIYCKRLCGTVSQPRASSSHSRCEGRRQGCGIRRAISPCSSSN